MSEDAQVNASATGPVADGGIVSGIGMQTGLCRWTAADRGRRSDNPFTLLYQRETPRAVWGFIVGNTDARAADPDAWTTAWAVGGDGHRAGPDGVRSAPTGGSVRAAALRERKIPSWASSTRPDAPHLCLNERVSRITGGCLPLAAVFERGEGSINRSWDAH